MTMSSSNARLAEEREDQSFIASPFTKEKLSKSDLRRVNMRWILGSQICWNYERMMSTGYVFAMLPIMKKLYKNKSELREVLKNHLQFFNTEPSMGHIILGANVAIEEEKGYQAKETVASIKTGLMGPFAGIGDTIFGVISSTIFGSIAAYMALNGSIIGLIIWICWHFLRLVIRWNLFYLGYKQGVSLVTTLSHKLKYVTEAATVLGLTVVGALIPSVIKADTPFVFHSGDVSLSVQEILDQIMPALFPVLLVGFVYWLLGLKKMNSSRVIFIVMFLSIVLYNTNVLG